MIVVQLKELNRESGTYVRRALLSVADDGTLATDTGEPTGLEDLAVYDPAQDRTITLEEDPRAWALNLPRALRTPYLVAEVSEVEG